MSTLIMKGDMYFDDLDYKNDSDKEDEVGVEREAVLSDGFYL